MASAARALAVVAAAVVVSVAPWPEAVPMALTVLATRASEEEREAETTTSF
jgi:hypothetical protein